MKILVTAFEPFNGRDMNPSQLILEQLEAPEGAPQAYFSNLPVWDMVKGIQAILKYFKNNP